MNNKIVQEVQIANYFLKKYNNVYNVYINIKLILDQIRN